MTTAVARMFHCLLTVRVCVIRTKQNWQFYCRRDDVVLLRRRQRYSGERAVIMTSLPSWPGALRVNDLIRRPHQVTCLASGHRAFPVLPRATTSAVGVAVDRVTD